MFLIRTINSMIITPVRCGSLLGLTGMEERKHSKVQEEKQKVFNEQTTEKLVKFEKKKKLIHDREDLLGRLQAGGDRDQMEQVWAEDYGIYVADGMMFIIQHQHRMKKERFALNAVLLC